MKISLEDAKRIAKVLGTTISPDRLLVGMNVELEHGTKSSKTNVTDDDLLETAKIALAHLEENPGGIGFGDYYDQLEEMEKRSDKYWESHIKPNIFGNVSMTAFDIMSLEL